MVYLSQKKIACAGLIAGFAVFSVLSDASAMMVAACPANEYSVPVTATWDAKDGGTCTFTITPNPYSVPNTNPVVKIGGGPINSSPIGEDKCKAKDTLCLKAIDTSIAMTAQESTVDASASITDSSGAPLPGVSGSLTYSTSTSKTLNTMSAF